MSGYVLNEYVNVDCINKNVGHFVAYYDPLDRKAMMSSIKGQICLIKPEKSIPFRQGSLFLLVDADDVLWGEYSNMSRRICLGWKNHPGEHYICASYEIYKEEPRMPFSWLKEGF